MLHNIAGVVLGTVGVPTILLILLIGLPFFDRRPERMILRRPVAVVTAILVVIAMGTLTWKGATAKEALGSETVGLVPEWAQKQGFADNADAVAGAKLFAESGCLNCHTYMGTGSSNLGAPDLTDEAPKNRGIQSQIDHLMNPSSKSPGSPMPSFAALGADNLELLATFLEASKGEKWRPEAEGLRLEGSMPGFSRASGLRAVRLPPHARLPRRHRSLRRTLHGPMRPGSGALPL